VPVCSICYNKQQLRTRRRGGRGSLPLLFMRMRGRGHATFDSSHLETAVRRSDNQSSNSSSTFVREVRRGRLVCLTRVLLGERVTSCHIKGMASCRTSSLVSSLVSVYNKQISCGQRGEVPPWFLPMRRPRREEGKSAGRRTRRNSHEQQTDGAIAQSHASFHQASRPLSHAASRHRLCFLALLGLKLLKNSGGFYLGDS
jgi:hypothetical protein